MKQFIAVLLAFIMVVLSVPMAFSKETPETPKTETDTDYQIEGTNSLGEMVEDALETEKEEYADADFHISNMSVEGQTVTVSFSNTASCVLVVAAYEEETMRMISSDTLVAEADMGEANVVLPDISDEDMVIKAFFVQTQVVQKTLTPPSGKRRRFYMLFIL